MKTFQYIGKTVAHALIIPEFKSETPQKLLFNDIPACKFIIAYKTGLIIKTQTIQLYYALQVGGSQIYIQDCCLHFQDFIFVIISLAQRSFIWLMHFYGRS